MRVALFVVSLLFFIGCNSRQYFPSIHRNIKVILPRDSSESFFVISNESKTNIALYDSLGLRALDTTVFKSFTNGKVERLNDSILLIDDSEDSTIFIYSFFTKAKKRLLVDYRLNEISNDKKYFLAMRRNGYYPMCLFKIENNERLVKIDSIEGIDPFTKSFGESKFIGIYWPKGGRRPESISIIDETGRITDSIPRNQKIYFNINALSQGRNPNELFILGYPHRDKIYQGLYTMDPISKVIHPFIVDINIASLALPGQDTFFIFRGYTQEEYKLYHEEVWKEKEKYERENPGSFIDYADAPHGRMMIRNIASGETKLLDKNIWQSFFSQSGATVASIIGDYNDRKVVIQSTRSLWENAELFTP